MAEDRSSDGDPRLARVARRLRRFAGGFTLLEVLVAVAILGLGLTVVLSAQTGVFWSYSRASHLSQAPSLVRCKMSEIELELLKEGYPLLDENDEGPCCEEQFDDEYTCNWVIEKVELPELLFDDADAGASGPPDDLAGGEVDGVLGQLGGLQSGALQHNGGGTQELTDIMSGAGAGSIATMAMTMVYPALKPMLEASIRRVTVTVNWKEGLRDRELTVTQYLTSPQQGGFDPLAAEGLAEEFEELAPGIGGGSP